MGRSFRADIYKQTIRQLEHARNKYTRFVRNISLIFLIAILILPPLVLVLVPPLIFNIIFFYFQGYSPITKIIQEEEQTLFKHLSPLEVIKWQNQQKKNKK